MRFLETESYTKDYFSKSHQLLRVDKSLENLDGMLEKPLLCE